MNQRTKLASALLVLALAVSLAAWSQETQPTGNTPNHASADSHYSSAKHYFRLTFRVLDSSAAGKVTNSRSYSETIVTKGGKTSSIRTGDRVPVATGSSSVQFQYIDIGTNIDAADVEFIDQTLRLYVTASISAISSAPPANSSLPIIRQTKWNSFVTVPINKPTLIFSADNSADKGKTELELTAVPISQ